MKDDALKVLSNAKLGTLATINEDGSPWSTPVQLSFRDGAIVWYSGIDAAHSQNLVRDNRVSITIVELNEGPSKAVFVSSRVKISDKTSYNEQYQKTMTEYFVPLGELDESKSEPNRYYFQFNEGNQA